MSSQAIVQTLETLIAPGKRARLSPFVESAQVEVLFGQYPEEHKRFEFIQQILKTNTPRISEIASYWAKFAEQGRRDFKSQEYTDQDFLDAYLAYYFSTNVCKIQLVLLDLVREGRLQGHIKLLDIGVGTGTTAVAFLDFVLTWGQVCGLYGESFPINSVELTGIDISKGSINHARKVVDAYAAALQRMQVGQISSNESQDNNLLQHVHQWASTAAWYHFDLNQNLEVQPPWKSIKDSNLVCASNVLNELEEDGRQNFSKLLQQLPDSALAIVIEPGDEKKSRELMTWRRDFCSAHESFVSISPCGQEFGHNLPHACNSCWNGRREDFHQTVLYKTFRKACNEQLSSKDKDRRSFDQFQNNLLSWSYVVIVKEQAKVDLPIPLNHLDQNIETIELRYIGTYHNKEVQLDIPDKKGNYVQYLKVCPAKLKDAVKVAIERPIGFQVPPLRFGQIFTVSQITLKPWREYEGVYTVIPNKNTELNGSEPNELQKSFFHEYSDRSRQGIDDVGYRLFGFPQMRDFQHEILSRALQGKNILGIAATGGGKSECFILPAILLPGITIAITPLKSLMIDQFEQRIKARYGLDHLVTYINGDVKFNERQARLKRMELGHYKLLYFTPEQLERGYVLDSLKRANEKVGIRYLAMDEAHCISQWGHDFRSSYLNICTRLKDHGIQPNIIALTATASPRVREDICEELGLSSQDDVFVHSSNRPEINLVTRVKYDTEEKVQDIVEELEKLKSYNQYNQDPGAAIIFMAHTGGDPDNTERYFDKSKNSGKYSTGVTPFASFLERKLARKVAIYHGKMATRSDDDISNEDAEDIDAKEKSLELGDLSGRTREEEQNAFIQGDRDRDIMVATKGFGMGIDKPNIRWVLHRSPPANLEAYAQEAGRAGRDGELATAILYYSPDTPEDSEAEDNSSKKKKKIRSDHDIQKFFLSDRYVRREDIQVLAAFLRTVKRGVNIPSRSGPEKLQYLYFTNDEAIYFFDKCCGESALAGLQRPYEWPEFENRESSGWESPRHKEILDIGYVYNLKTAYINRILAVLYRIRPDISSIGKQAAFITSFQETGAWIKNPEVKSWSAIINSNSYFGEILRSNGINEEQFKYAIQSDNLLNLAQQLNMSLNELTAMLGDIKSCDGHLFRERWTSNLFNFWWIEAPKFLPAPDLNSLPDDSTRLQAWRSYAGAQSRASKKEALNKSKRSGREKSTDDDWFPWKNLNRSIGWEIRPGHAFYDQANFDAYLDAFINLHDERERDDWASYHRLLTSYIGVNENGTIPPSTAQKRCLRAIMLGYLKSNEVISGGNCLSCSNCVPDENFEQYTVERRRQAVVRILSQTETILDEVENFAETFPPEILIDNLFKAIEREEKEGRSLIQYVEGWSGRLLQDTPDHRSALLVRIKAMIEGVFDLQKQEFIENAKKLVRLTLEVDITQLMWKLMSQAHELVPGEPDIYRIQAKLCRRFNLLHGEVQSLERLLDEIDKDSSNLNELFEIFTRLKDLYSPVGSLANAESYQKYLCLAARFSRNLEEARALYASTKDIWTWEEVREESQNCEQYGNSSAILGLFDLYLTGGDKENKDSEQRSENVASYLQKSPGDIFQVSNVEDIEIILNSLSFAVLTKNPALSASFSDHLLLNSSKNVKVTLELAVIALLEGEDLSKVALANLVTLLLSNFGGIALDIADLKILFSKLLPFFEPQSAQDLDSWLHIFPVDFYKDHSTEVKANLFQQVSTYLKEISLPVIDKLETILNFEEEDNESLSIIHESWIMICKKSPGKYVLHIQKCSRKINPQSVRAETAFDALLNISNYSFSQHLKVCLQQISSQEAESYPEKLLRLSRFFKLLQMYVDQYGALEEPTGSSLHQLRKIFCPHASIERANMLIAVLDFLMSEYKLNPAWLTPISLKAECLCHAGRFKEATKVAQQHPDLQIGRDRAPIFHVIENQKKMVEEAPPDPAFKDYQKILEIFYSNLGDLPF